MDYFNILNLIKEPFSNSPDPDFFYQSRQHQGCLQQLEISLRLRRGLNVVIGDVGIGKTTICRQLIRRFADSDDTETHLILDPNYLSPEEFTYAVAEKFGGDNPVYGMDALQVKERIKQYLFRQGVNEQKNVVLIIDEGQKLPMFCLEILREFLNYETNQHKLLQIVIFAQAEFEKTIKAHAYFADRINFFHRLKALKFSDTRAMILYRLRQSSDGSKPLPIFSFLAFWAIYSATGGYPRKIVNLCHQCIVAMLVQNRNEADWLLVRGCAGKIFNRTNRKQLRPALIFLLFLIVVVAVATMPGTFNLSRSRQKPALKTATFQLPPPKPDIEANFEPADDAKPYLAAIHALSNTVEKGTSLPSQPEVAPKNKKPSIDTPKPMVVAPVDTTKKTVVLKPLYTVQTGAFHVATNARRRVAALVTKGYQAYIYQATDGRKRTWYTVRIGSFADLAQARKLRRQLKTDVKIAAFITFKDSLTPVPIPATGKRP
jgi:type II secretory pathway predicted ATPase ExeA